jgi:DNA-binding NarL/FixJ family response regulator
MTVSHNNLYLMGASALDRHAYRLLLRGELSREVTLESDFAAVAVWNAMRENPRLVLVLADRVSAEVRDAVEMIPRLCLRARILVASEIMDPTVLQSWGPCGIHGYVVKHGGVRELGRALCAVESGGFYFSDGTEQQIRRRTRARSGCMSLSRRETELLPLLARGMPLRTAAAELNISYKTADSYRTSLFRKVGVRDRVELSRYAIRQRIIDP